MKSIGIKDDTKELWDELKKDLKVSDDLILNMIVKILLKHNLWVNDGQVFSSGELIDYLDIKKKK